MSVAMVTVRKGGTREAMIAATRKLKAVVEKHGAESFALNQIVIGASADSGQWVIVIGFTDWEAFGKGMQATTNDPASHEALAGVDSISQIVSHRAVAGVDL
jgi:predicted pyridoxine 5'-phosphate oxidase superfamily flavin-nucleotide-binding protein